MEDENLYDEFGNYIGPEMDMSEGSDSDSGDASDSDARRQGGQAGSGSASSNYAYEKPVSDFGCSIEFGSRNFAL